MSNHSECQNNEERPNLSEYYINLDKKIHIILTRKKRERITYDILDTKTSIRNKSIILKEKQYQMKIGEIWQEAIGSFPGFINLYVGHDTGLDIISHTRKIAIELKNRTNTDNSSSKKTNLDKLASFKKSHPDYTCIYANINADTKEKTLCSKKQYIYHNDVIIEKQIGITFLHTIFSNDMEDVVNFIKEKVEKYNV